MTGRVSNSFPPHVLREYAVLADGERGAVLGPQGDIVWMCLPRWDDDAVFTSLLGGRGVYAVTPSERFVWGGYYEPGSLIWVNRWTTDTGIIECRDALAYPGDPDRAVLLRTIVAREGDATVDIVLDPRANFGKTALTRVQRDGDVWTARSGAVRLRWQGAPEARRSTSRAQTGLRMTLKLKHGEHRDLVLELSDRALPDEPENAQAAWYATSANWPAAVPELPQALDPRQTRHSVAVLRGMTSSSGGMVAAATTSLPERAQAGRNYDYRYAWIRDQCYMGVAAARAGLDDLVRDSVRFVGARLRADGDRMMPAYTTAGAPIPEQRRIGLPGYPGGFDLVGNRVVGQFQLDVFGEALELFAEAARRDLLDGDGWRAAEIAADAIAARWQEPDAGIWEIDDKPWTHSRLTAASGLRAIAAVAAVPGPATEWIALADRIVADTSAHALHPDGYWQRAPDDPGLDGSLLLCGLRGAVPGDDPRTRATLEAYDHDLTQDGFAYRFRHDGRPLSHAEGSFLLCGFVMALARHQQGDVVAAHGWWERTRAACGPSMLFAEEYDAEQHQLRGNLPQAFVHALMLETAVTLGR
jgi:GH15 family glucan-1,4-alpha-glucosidase